MRRGVGGEVEIGDGTVEQGVPHGPADDRELVPCGREKPAQFLYLGRDDPAQELGDRLALLIV
ncbi:hypothetical protein GCM10010468_33090 [Actinocorallia longicatena]|uniref:Uncharacterized protein n=1 Tax=Actinocorallia longicatena TaxID=111803 RepID=A0ABP6QCT4_9ACTN